MMESAIAGGAYFVYVFLRAFQQKNVAFDHYKWVMPISYAMSIVDVAVMSIVAYKVATEGITWELLIFALCLGTGGGLGAMTAMWTHNRYIK